MMREREREIEKRERINENYILLKQCYIHIYTKV